jgi:hypothetical protein
VQCLLIGGTYHLAGAAPLAFHAVNTATLITAAVLLQAALRALRLPRAPALGVALLWAMLPHYATDRFWMAAMQASASAALCFLAAYAQLRSVPAGPRARVGWWTLATAAGIFCVLAYEVFLPLLLITPVLTWLHARRRAADGVTRAGTLAHGRGLLTLLALAAVPLAPVLAWKVAVTTRLAGADGWAAQLAWFSWMLRSYTAVSAVDLSLWLPRVVWRLGRYHPTPHAVPVALACALAAGAYVAWLGIRADGGRLRPRLALGMVAAGAALFYAGFAVFVTTMSASVTPSGIGNRVVIAAAVGVALIWVAGSWTAVGWLPGRRARALSFGGAIGGLFGACVFVNLSLAGFWIEAYRRERAVIAAIVTELPRHPGAGSLIVDGFCPYVGPAVVFEAPWDLAGALQLAYGRRGLRADVVTPALEPGDSLLTTWTYNPKAVTSYPYERMLVLNVARRRRVAIADAAGMRRYLEANNPDRSGGCPPGRPGHGVTVF